LTILAEGEAATSASESVAMRSKGEQGEYIGCKARYIEYIGELHQGFWMPLQQWLKPADTNSFRPDNTVIP